MKVVWKFPLAVEDIQQVEIPQEAKVLTVQVQNGIPCIWALVESENGLEKRTFRLAGTGHDLEPASPNEILEYVGTFQLLEGKFIGHLFEIKEKPMRL